MATEPVWYPQSEDPSLFWERLGMVGDLPAHLPMGVDSQGRGPADQRDIHHYVCWCADPACSLTLALAQARRSAVRNIKISPL